MVEVKRWVNERGLVSGAHSPVAFDTQAAPIPELMKTILEIGATSCLCSDVARFRCMDMK